MGRPSKYSEALADAICEQIASGRSLLKITDDLDYPSENTVYRWISTIDAFREKYAHARELQAEHYAQEIVDLADCPVEARKVVIKADGSEEITIGDNVERTRVQIDARKWYASKLYPKKYSEKLQQELSGPDGGPLQAAITVQFVKTGEKRNVPSHIGTMYP
jgi:hypothetical protein